jgi:hypothetical protein
MQAHEVTRFGNSVQQNSVGVGKIARTLSLGLARILALVLSIVVGLVVVLLPLSTSVQAWVWIPLGNILFSWEAFLEAIHRDWRLNLGVGILAAASALAIAASTGTFDLEAPPRTLLDILFWILISIDSWCWTLFFLFIGIRYLDYTDKYLEYGQSAILPFFVYHQPVIITLAYYAVQWQVGLVLKLLFVVIGSLCVTLSIYEFLVRRIALLSLLFGMKMTPSAKTAS